MLALIILMLALRLILMLALVLIPILIILILMLALVLILMLALIIQMLALILILMLALIILMLALILILMLALVLILMLALIIILMLALILMLVCSYPCSRWWLLSTVIAATRCGLCPQFWPQVPWNCGRHFEGSSSRAAGFSSRPSSWHRAAAWKSASDLAASSSELWAPF